MITCSSTATALKAAVLVVTPAGAPPNDGAAAFAGRWRVEEVALSSIGVHTLAHNDPSLMGKTLVFSPVRLTWDRPTATHDTCTDPTFTRTNGPAPADLRPQLRKLGLPRPTGFTVRSGSGSGTVGPGVDAVIFRGAGGALAMPWCGGGVLKLVPRWTAGVGGEVG